MLSNLDDLFSKKNKKYRIKKTAFGYMRYLNAAGVNSTYQLSN